MVFWKILVIALALAMDAFAVAIVSGFSLRRVSFRQVFRLSWHFGFFQATNTLLGWTLGLTMRSLIAAWDHWVAFVLLFLVGGKMIFDSFSGESCKPDDPTRGLSLITLSVATSIDALAVGLGFAVLDVSIWIPAALIGLVALVMTVVGLYLGTAVGCRVPIGPFAERSGGALLIAIGVHILIDHGVLS
jgi:putative Mn2+ efflux pump MntP